MWRDEYGTVAFGWSDSPRSSMRLPGVGLFGWTDSEAEWTASPEPGVEHDAVVDAFRRCVLPMALQAEGREVLHASAVLMPQGAVALCGRSRTGKSTLAYGLSRHLNRPLWADDAVAVELTEQGVSVLALPFSLKLRPPSERYFRTDARAAGPREDNSAAARLVPLAAVFILTRSDTPRGAVRASRTEGGHAFTALLEHAYCFDLENPVRRAQMVDQYLELSARVPVFELSFPSGLHVLPATLAEVTRALESELDHSAA